MEAGFFDAIIGAHPMWDDVKLLASSSTTNTPDALGHTCDTIPRLLRAGRSTAARLWGDCLRNTLAAVWLLH